MGSCCNRCLCKTFHEGSPFGTPLAVTFGPSYQQRGQSEGFGASAVGALPILFILKLSKRAQDVMLG